MLQRLLRAHDASLCVRARLERLPQYRSVRPRLRQQRGLQPADLSLRMPGPTVQRRLLCCGPGVQRAVRGLLHESDGLHNYQPVLPRVLLPRRREGRRRLRPVREHAVQDKRGVLPELRVREGGVRTAVLLEPDRQRCKETQPDGAGAALGRSRAVRAIRGVSSSLVQGERSRSAALLAVRARA